MADHLELIQRAAEARRKFLETLPDSWAELRHWEEFIAHRREAHKLGYAVTMEMTAACTADSEQQHHEDAL